MYLLLVEEEEGNFLPNEGKGKYLLPFPNSLISTRSLDYCLWWLLSADIVEVVIICQQTLVGKAWEFCFHEMLGTVLQLFVIYQTLYNLWWFLKYYFNWENFTRNLFMYFMFMSCFKLPWTLLLSDCKGNYELLALPLFVEKIFSLTTIFGGYRWQTCIFFCPEGAEPH